jgi:hypothetical protein
MKKLLTESEFKALCRALQGGMFDQVSGSAIRKEVVIAEVVEAPTSCDEEDDWYELEAVAEKLESLTEEQVEEVLELVNAQYRIGRYAEASDAMHSACVCDACRHRYRMN